MSFKDLASSESRAEDARAESQQLAAALRKKTVRYSADGKLEPWRDGPKTAEPVQGEFTPQTAGLAVAHDAIILEGGPFDGQETKVPRGAALHERPAASTDGFYPARYRRTAKRDDSGLTVFQFQADQAAA